MGAARTFAPLAPRPGPVDQWRKEAPISLLKLANDEVLVQDVRGGSERAFKVIYERYQRPILAFCRHMLGSHEEAEDAVQQTFISAYRDILRDGKELNLRPWLYRIARNHCISAIRKRRPTLELGDREPSTIGLPAEVESRSELRALLADLERLPEAQREALLLTELESNSHAEVAEILGCDRERVKSLVFQARKALMNSREARELPCREVRKRIGVVRGAGLRQGALGRHLKLCEDCRAFEREVRAQRQQLAVLLVVTPSAALKLGAASAIAAAGSGGEGAGGAIGSGAGTASSASPVGSAAGSASGFSPGLVGGAAGIGSTATVAKFALPAMLVKGAATVVAVGVLATGAAVGAQRVAERVRAAGSPPAQGVKSTGPSTVAEAPAARPPGSQPAASTDTAAPERAPSSSNQDSAAAGSDSSPASSGQSEPLAPGSPGTPETSPLPAAPTPVQPLAAPRLHGRSVHSHPGHARPYHSPPARGQLESRSDHRPADHGRPHGRSDGRRGGPGPNRGRPDHPVPNRGHSPRAGLPGRPDRPGQQHEGKPSPVTPKPAPPGQTKPPGTPANPKS